jgi:hypothetical protein
MGGRELIGLERPCRINSQRASRSSSLPRPFASADPADYTRSSLAERLLPSTTPNPVMPS